MDGYEALCRALTVVLGVMNLLHRGSVDSVPPHPRFGKGKPFAANLDDFHGKPNAPKLELFSESDLLDRLLSQSIDPKLRNAAGHKAITYLEAESLVSYGVNRSGDKVETMSLG